MRADGERSQFLDQSTAQIVGVALCLRADEIVIEHHPQQFAASGQDAEHFGGGPWNVVEIADGIGHAQSAKLGGQRHQVIIMDPDKIVRPEQLRQRMGEGAVDPLVACVISPREFRQADPVMHDRPQGAIGEAAVIFLPVLRGEVHHRILHRALVNDLGLG